MTSSVPYNPLDKKHLGESVADALLKTVPKKLGELEPFRGAGIYALYYAGEHPLYTRLSATMRGESGGHPIYVGKAVPKGARKGGFGLGEDPGPALHGRLKKHAQSIEQAEDLALKDFQCRFLVVEDIWIPLGENLLISKFSPVWNSWVDGFGNHDPGKGRYNQIRSRWDVLHPGRPFAEKCQPRDETRDQIAADIAARLADVFG